MKFSHVLPLAALSSALVLPSEEVLGQVAIEKDHRGRLASWFDEAVEAKDAVASTIKHHAVDVAEESKDVWHRVTESSKVALDDAFEYASQTVSTAHDNALDAAMDMQDWLSAGAEDLYEYASDTASTVHDSAQDAAIDMQDWLSAGAEDLYDELEDHHGPPPPPPTSSRSSRPRTSRPRSSRPRTPRPRSPRPRTTRPWSSRPPSCASAASLQAQHDCLSVNLQIKVHDQVG
nr:hypothetical protein CFP56_54411 [Quercus suber]